ncbi:hypothetical protein ACFW38_002163 [Salmonella enterica]
MATASNERLYHSKYTSGSGISPQQETLGIWRFPVGVKLNKTVDLDAGWALSTQADFAVITHTGDT